MSQANEEKILIGLVDADLLCNETRHPNLVLMKLAGFLHDNNIDFHLNGHSVRLSEN